MTAKQVGRKEKLAAVVCIASWVIYSVPMFVITVIQFDNNICNSDRDYVYFYIEISHAVNVLCLLCCYMSIIRCLY